MAAIDRVPSWPHWFRGDTNSSTSVATMGLLDMTDPTPPNESMDVDTGVVVDSTPVEGKCNARRRDGSGGLCRRVAGWGTPHKGIGRCSFHGGSTPTHVRAAERDHAVRQAVFFGAARDIDPDEALLEEVQRTAGHVAWLGAEVAELDAAVGVVHPLIVVYQSERSHLVTVAKAAIGVGIAERQVRVAERQGELVARVLLAVIDSDEVAMSPAQREVARRVAGAQLRALGPGDET